MTNILYTTGDSVSNEMIIDKLSLAENIDTLCS